MKRPLMALLLTLAIGVQGSLAAFAAVTPTMQPDGQMATKNHHAASHTCCPDNGSRASCCPDACVAAVAVTPSAGLLAWQGRTAPAIHFQSTTFSSRGESPLVRPPIL
jgi:hypothetical protein